MVIELDHFGDEQDLARDPAIGESALQPFIDQPLMRGMLIDDDQRVSSLGDDEGAVNLRACGAERIARTVIFLRHAGARVGARRGDRSEWRLGLLGKAERARAVSRHRSP